MYPLSRYVAFVCTDARIHIRSGDRTRRSYVD
jgi:hypothetical protein